MKDHHRITPMGREMGLKMAARIEPVIQMLMREDGEPDGRCKSCAYTAGTVPNGCLQTQMDALKATLEQTPFTCHVLKNQDGTPQFCAGWLASQWGAASRPVIKCPWEFSPPDKDTQ